MRSCSAIFHFKSKWSRFHLPIPSTLRYPVIALKTRCLRAADIIGTSSCMSGWNSLLSRLLLHNTYVQVFRSGIFYPLPVRRSDSLPCGILRSRFTVELLAKARFPLHEFTARVDGWPVSITHYSVSGNACPSTRPVLTGNGNRSPVNSGR